MILVINTSSENAYIGIYDKKILAELSWNVGKTLSADLLNKISELFVKADSKIEEIAGIIACSGPGSFTGLRIGISTANTIAYSLDVPIVGVSGNKIADEFLKEGKVLLEKEKKNFGSPLEPAYGMQPSVTISKKVF
jgi:tRNA threonylcarbamoyladenosine biosynthesis protein TsaB